MPGGRYVLTMLDVLLIALVIAFFVLADLFVRACASIVDRGRRDRDGEGS